MNDLLSALSNATPDDLAAWRRLVERAGAAAVASWLAPRALIACMLGDTRFAAAALETLRAPESPAALQVGAAFPEAVALAHPAPPQIEHDPPSVAGTGSRASQPRPLSITSRRACGVDRDDPRSGRHSARRAWARHVEAARIRARRVCVSSPPRAALRHRGQPAGDAYRSGPVSEIAFATSRTVATSASSSRR